MAVKKSRVYKKNVKVESNLNGSTDSWNYPGQSRELSIKTINKNLNNEQLEKQRTSIIEDMERKNYILIEDEYDIVTLFKNKANGKITDFYAGTKLFFIWKYSQLLAITDDEDERAKFLESITESEEALIMQEVIRSKICKMANFFDEKGRYSLSQNHQLCIRDEADNVISELKNGKYRLARGNIGLFDLSLNTIKKVIEDLDLRPVKKETVKKVDKIKKKS